MESARHIIAGVIAMALGLAISARAGGPSAKDTILGVALSPAHVPNPSDADLRSFFSEAAMIGGHVVWICEWESMPPLATIRKVRDVTVSAGLQFHFYISPIALFGGRKNPAIPKSIGASSFNDPRVRKAYQREVLELASLKPEYLGLATEVNFLAQNPAEYAAFVSLAHDTYRAVKAEYPRQAITLSFQWEFMKSREQFAMLKDFADSVDVYSFTSYPDAFGYPVKIPNDYYKLVREYLPTQRIGFSEVGWSSAAPSDELEQAEFYERIPTLIAPLKPEYISLALLHDVAVFSGGLERLNHAGIRTIDDEPKPSWQRVLELPVMR